MDPRSLINVFFHGGEPVLDSVDFPFFIINSHQHFIIASSNRSSGAPRRNIIYAHRVESASGDFTAPPPFSPFAMATNNDSNEYTGDFEH